MRARANSVALRPTPAARLPGSYWLLPSGGQLTAPHCAAPAGLSKAMALDQTHVTTHSLGTITHMPPELFK